MKFWIELRHKDGEFEDGKGIYFGIYHVSMNVKSRCQSLILRFKKSSHVKYAIYIVRRNTYIIDRLLSVYMILSHYIRCRSCGGYGDDYGDGYCCCRCEY